MHQGTLQFFAGCKIWKTGRDISRAGAHEVMSLDQSWYDMIDDMIEL